MNPKGMPLFDSAKAYQTEETRKYLDNCKKAAEEIAKRNGTVTMTDIHKVHPRPVGIKSSVDGSVFRNNKKFRQCGTRKSETESRQGSIERIWTLA